MKRAQHFRLSVYLLVLLFILFLDLTSQAYGKEQTWRTYKSQEFNEISYSIDYSPDWEVKELSPNMVAFSPGDFEVAIGEVAVNVAIQDLRNWGHTSLSLDGYIKIYDKNIPEMLLNFVQLRREKTRIADQEAYLTVYRATDKIDTEWHMKSKTYIFVVNDMFAYEVGYTAVPEKYETYLSEADKMMKSFKLYHLSENQPEVQERR